MNLQHEINKPENSFQNYDLAKNEPECQKKFPYIRIILIQPSEMQKPETGQKTGPGPTGKFNGQMNQHVKRNLLT